MCVCVCARERERERERESVGDGEIAGLGERKSEKTHKTLHFAILS